MPSLTPFAYNGETNVPCLWRCTECEEGFDAGRILSERPSAAQVEDINRRFRQHCEENHPGSAAIEMT
jgi:hypothetical protein